MENNNLLTTSEHKHELEDAQKHILAELPNETIAHTALAYAKCGLSILPVKPDKSPALRSLDSVKRQIASEAEIPTWFTPGSTGIGILCGAISGNLECIDIDEKHNVDAVPLVEQMAALVDKETPGLWGRLVRETSINGGQHLLYRCRSIEGSRKLAQRQKTEAEVLEAPKGDSVTLIETRGEGGYFVSAPSPGYRVVSGSLQRIPEITVEERSILLQCARALNQYSLDQKHVSGYAKPRRAAIERPGDDFNNRGDISQVLLDTGWKYVWSADGVQYWRRPGKSEGISASFNKHPGMFYVFTSNASPLEPETWYSKFALLGLLVYGGNFSAAALDLMEKGYGATVVAKAESFLDQSYEFRFNVVTGRTEYKEKSTTEFVVLEDYDLNTLSRKLQHAHIKIGTDALAALLSSDYAKRFDPFVEYYEALPKWDGTTDHIGQLAETVTLKEADDEKKKAFRIYLRRWLIAAAGCAVNERVVNHTCLVLVGPQGRYKTTWLNRLVPTALGNYIHVGTIDPADKDTHIHLTECFLINLDELETLQKKELGTLKSILTYSSSRLRRPYGRFATQMVRRASFVGSINRDTFLTDETGSRRFLVVEIESIDANHGLDMDKVHAQAYALFKRGERYWFDAGEIDVLTEQNKRYAVQTTEDELVRQYCVRSNGTSWMSATQVAEEISKQTRYPLTASSARNFGFALRKAGLEPRKLNGISEYPVMVPAVAGLYPTLAGVQVGSRSGVTSSGSP